MSLSRYFSKQQISPMSAHTRMRVYSDFLKKRERQSLSRRTKVMGTKKVRQTSMVILSGIVLLAGSFLFNFNGEKPSIMADNIGHITKQTKTNILSNGRNITSDSIQLYDQINIENGGSVTIRMNNGFDVNVPGPASFTIVPSLESTDLGSYTIQFNTPNNYIAIDSLNSNKDKDSNTDKHIVSVKMGDVLFQPKRKDEEDKISFIVNNTVSSARVTNKGETEILVISDNAKGNILNNSETTIIASEQITEIATSTESNNIAVLTSMPFNSGNVIIAAGGPDDEKPKTTNANTIKNISIKQSGNTTNSGNTINYSDDGRVILSSEDINKLKNNLNGFFVEYNINNIVIYHLLGNRDASSIARSNLLARFNNINAIIGSNPTYQAKGSTISDLIEYNTYLIKQIDTIYNMPYTASKNLQVTRNWLKLSDVYKSGMLRDMATDIVTVPTIDEVLEASGIKKITAGQSIYTFSKR